MTVMESYMGDLAAALRTNGIAENKVIEILREIASDPLVDPGSPQVRLGAPEELARSFGRGTARSAGFKVISSAVGVAAAIAGTRLVLWLFAGVGGTPLEVGAVYGGALVVAVAGILTAAQVDRRLPSGVRDLIR